jgi:hypothetical protein
MLGFKTQVSLEEGLRRLVEWWTQQCAAQPAAVQAQSMSPSLRNP